MIQVTSTNHQPSTLTSEILQVFEISTSSGACPPNDIGPFHGVFVVEDVGEIPGYAIGCGQCWKHPHWGQKWMISHQDETTHRTLIYQLYRIPATAETYWNLGEHWGETEVNAIIWKANPPKLKLIIHTPATTLNPPILFLFLACLKLQVRCCSSAASERYMAGMFLSRWDPPGASLVITSSSPEKWGSWWVLEDGVKDSSIQLFFCHVFILFHTVPSCSIFSHVHWVHHSSSPHEPDIFFASPRPCWHEEMGSLSATDSAAQ